MLISRDLSLIVPLTSTLGLRDMYDLIEVVTVDAHNDAMMRRAARAKE